MDIKYVLLTDFERVCRICMKFDKTFLSINTFNIIDMIVACASVQIWENDDLPNQICNSCFLQLQNTISFKKLCQNSDNAFRQIIEENDKNLVNNENDLDDIKEEELDNHDYGNDNSPVYIKEETIFENKDVLKSVNTKIDHNEIISKKSENVNIENGEILKIKNDDSLELNKIQTRRKTAQYKFEEESDESNDEKSDSDWDSEDNNDSYKEEKCKKEYKCELCSAIFKRVDALGLHMHKKHDADGTKCRKCSVVCYHVLHLHAHEKLHNKCGLCKLTFSTRQKLKKHKLKHYENSHEVACEICSSVVASKHYLTQHMKHVHKIETKRPLKCEACDESFKTKQLLIKHVRSIHPKVKNKYKEQIVNCEICGKTLKRCYLRKHMTTHGERDKIACEYCSKIFISQETLQTHVKIYHKNSGPVCKFLCSECGLKLRSRAELKNHLLTHTRERPYACDKCDKTYRTTFMLKQHISRVHLNERNFICTYCSQAFYDKKILLNHVRRHTGEKPFKCHMCEKRFIQKAALRVHMKVHSNPM